MFYVSIYHDNVTKKNQILKIRNSNIIIFDLKCFTTFFSTATCIDIWCMHESTHSERPKFQWSKQISHQIGYPFIK